MHNNILFLTLCSVIRINRINRGYKLDNITDPSKWCFVISQKGEKTQEGIKAKKVDVE